MAIVTLVYQDQRVKLDLPARTTTDQLKKLVHAAKECYMIIKYNRHPESKTCQCFACTYGRRATLPSILEARWDVRKTTRLPTLEEWAQRLAWPLKPSVEERLGFHAWVEVRLAEQWKGTEVEAERRGYWYQRNGRVNLEDGQEYYFVPDEEIEDYLDRLAGLALEPRAGFLMILPALWQRVSLEGKLKGWEKR